MFVRDVSSGGGSQIADRRKPAALTAAAFLRECAEVGTLTPEVVRHVKRFLRRLEAEPLLAFEPPAND